MIDLDTDVEKVLAVSFLNEASGKGTALVDTFSSWMIGGHGVAVMLLLSQFDSSIKHIYPHSITVFLYQFSLSLILAILQKYISLIVSSASNAGQTAMNQFNQFSFDRTTFNIEKFNEQIDLALTWPASWIVRHQRSKNDDFALPSRRTFVKFQFQCFLVFFQAILLLFAITQLGRAFHA